MKIIAAPTFAWEGKHFRCPSCTAVIEFELSDLRAKNTSFTKGITGAWTVSNVTCPICGALGRFLQLPEGTP
jgi:predicted RNA-binding Zn-ribbon protein involved in translation (DUF1610 family)